MTGSILILSSATLGYLAYQIHQNDAAINEVIDQQGIVLDRLQTVHSTEKAFDDVRYWLTDLSVSFLNESEELADARNEDLLALFEKLRQTDCDVVDTVQPIVAKLRDAMLEAVDAYVDENRVLGNAKISEARGASSEVDKALGDLVVKTNALARESTQSIVQSNTTLLITCVVGLVAAIAIGSALAWAFSKKIVEPIQYAVTVADTIAAGNLACDIEIRSNDETGQLLVSLRKMRDNLTRVIREIMTTSEAVQRGAEEISAGNTNLSERTDEQASRLGHTASSMNEMTATVKQNADNAEQARKLAATAHRQAEQGRNVAGRALSGMMAISDSSKKIQDIIGVIEEIAFRTNLLALNAAVEAARAGEHGRGFAVVAAEVEKLAQQVGTEAREINGMIGESVSNIADGRRLVEESSNALEDLVNSAGRVGELISEIAAASREQYSGIGDVNTAVSQMDEMTQRNAALVQEAAAASEEITGQATGLYEKVSFFTLAKAGSESPCVESEETPPAETIA